MTLKHHCIVLEFSTEKDVQDLLDLIAGRVYAMEGVRKAEVTASTMDEWLETNSGRLVPSRPLSLVDLIHQRFNIGSPFGFKEH